MKKLFFIPVFFTIAFTVLCMVAAPDNATAASKQLKIALVLWRGETPAEKGFKDTLKRQGYDITYTIVNAGQDISRLADGIRKENKFIGYDYVYAFGTTVSKFLCRVLDEKTAIVFNVVTAPVKAGIVNSLSAPGKNISGVSNMISLDLEIQNAFKVFPFKKLGVFFNPREKNSEIIKAMLIRMGKTKGFTVIPLRCPPVGPLFEENLKKTINNSIDVDAVYFPSDSFLVSNAERIGRVMRQGKVISIGAIKKYIEKGVMMGTVPDYYTLGTLAAGIIDRNQHGEKLSDIPVQTQQDPSLVINKTTADLMHIKIDAALLEKAVIIP